jgi:hypothetical protein
LLVAALHLHLPHQTSPRALVFSALGAGPALPPRHCLLQVPVFLVPPDLQFRYSSVVRDLVFIKALAACLLRLFCRVHVTKRRKVHQCLTLMCSYPSKFIYFIIYRVMCSAIFLGNMLISTRRNQGQAQAIHWATSTKFLGHWI